VRARVATTSIDEKNFIVLKELTGVLCVDCEVFKNALYGTREGWGWSGGEERFRREEESDEATASAHIYMRWYPRKMSGCFFYLIAFVFLIRPARSHFRHRSGQSAASLGRPGIFSRAGEPAFEFL
jgi:hypothetical protein